MITPAVASKVAQFYALGNTPAVNLVRDLPQGLDANVLMLGCGDLRNVFYTAYANTGFTARKIDVTSCDIEEGIVARNLVILSFLVDGGKTLNHDLLWNISYHVLLSETDAESVSVQAKKLLDVSESLSAWKFSKYGMALPFCDEATLQDVRKLWVKYASAGDREAIVAALANLQLSRNARTARNEEMGGGMVLTGMRSAAPAGLHADCMHEVSSAHTHFWETGVTGSVGASAPNPLITCYISNTKLLHYGTDPILGFHLVTAFTPLTEASPLQLGVRGEKFKVVAAAKVQFRAWLDAATSLIASNKLVVRSTSTDVFAFCHTLQHWAASGEASAGWYRRQLDPRALKLDTTAGTPKVFDAIDTSNLADHVGTLNILVSTLPLLSPEPCASLATETLLQSGGEADTEMMNRVLQGHGLSVSLLLGVSIIESWTNATSVSKVSEIMVMEAFASGGGAATQLHTRVSWKHAGQLADFGASQPRLRVSPDDLARMLFQMYLQMFKHENAQSVISATMSGKGFTTASGYVHFQRGSFAAFLRLVKARFAGIDFAATCSALDNMITEDSTLQLGNNCFQDLGAQLLLQDLPSLASLHLDMKAFPTQGNFSTWKHIPPASAVTMVIPRSFIAPLFDGSVARNFAAPTFIGSLTLGSGASVGGHNLFGGVQLVFGTLSKHGSPGSDDYFADIIPDPAGWAGDAPLVASFYVPTKALLSELSFLNAGLEVLPTPQNIRMFCPILGQELKVYQTNILDRDRVCITKFMPGHKTYPVYCGAARQLEPESDADKTTSYTVVTDDSGWVASINGHHDIRTETGQRLLKEMIPIELRQVSPYTINIVFGNKDLVLPLQFPYPVDSTRAKTRVARKSAYIEVIAPFADPLTTWDMEDYVYPSVLGHGNGQEMVPLTLNLPHLSLDTLPILDVSRKSDLGWLSTLITTQFSARERKTRNENLAAPTGLTKSCRLNFKESLFTMFMLSAGIQAEQTGLFAINHPERGGIHMLLFVSAIRVDSAAGSVVLDAAVLPFTMELVASKDLYDFLLVLSELGMCSMTVDDAELILWKKALPSFAERARTWSHKKDCEYRVKKTVPLSLEPSQPVLCSCGWGKIPKDFVALPEWEDACKYVTRVAISTTYSAPFVEDILDIRGMPTNSGSRGGGPATTQAPPKDRCANCGTTAAKGTKDGPLKKCTRCRKAAYCGAECQKENWKEHRLECKASK